MTEAAGRGRPFDHRAPRHVRPGAVAPDRRRFPAAAGTAAEPVTRPAAEAAGGPVRQPVTARVSHASTAAAVA